MSCCSPDVRVAAVVSEVDAVLDGEGVWSRTVSRRALPVMLCRAVPVEVIELDLDDRRVLMSGAITFAEQIEKLRMICSMLRDEAVG